jgi:lipopolysaccharide/colanic/teichoic acid biosynthesis glycosyltransferase
MSCRQEKTVRPLHVVRGIDDLSDRSPNDEHRDARTFHGSSTARRDGEPIATSRPRAQQIRLQPGEREFVELSIAQFTAIVGEQLPHDGSLVIRGSYPARYRYAKRSFDLIVGSICLIVVAPLIALLGILVRLDSPGPAFFTQTRVGFRGGVFSIIKLRTMIDRGRDGGEPIREDEERVTRIGRYLRRWSLDELPQLINVVRGQMSLVGPRPELPEIVLARYERWQYQRFLVPQGMTGWWQITDRGTTQLCDDTEDDLAYLDRASFLVDLKILLMTIPAVIRQARML